MQYSNLIAQWGRALQSQVSVSVCPHSNASYQPDKHFKIYNKDNLVFNINLNIFVFFQPEPSSLDFSTCVVRGDDDNSSQQVCGVCLLTVNVTSTDDRLTYAGRNYHTPCANLWVNCVNSTLPALKLPHLL